MPYITSIERLAKREGFEAGIQQGLQQGIQQGIQQGSQQGILEGLYRTIEMGLKLKFGIPGLKLLPEIKGIEDLRILETISSAIEKAEQPEDLRNIYLK